jgi:hypothetical protein
VFGNQPVGLIDERHPAQRFLADLLHALGGLGDVADDEVLLGDLHDVGSLKILPSANRISATMRAKLVLAVPGGPSSTMWFSLVADVSSPWAASSWSI